MNKDTGFHPHDADWTRGRGIAISQADGIARMQAGFARKAVMRPNLATPSPNSRHDPGLEAGETGE